MNVAGTKPTAAMPARLDAADLTIVGGAGHVGIPLVLAFAEAGYRVNVHTSIGEPSRRCAPAVCRSSNTAARSCC